MRLPDVGAAAPDFELPGTDGTVKLSDFRGQKNVVLYFYPKDDTPGCTKEACGFRDLTPQFAAQDAVIFGVSADPMKSHEKFAAKYSLGFPLLSDEGGKVAQTYGAWGEKSFMGRKSIGMLRTTFVIDKNGRVARVFPNVKVDGHVDEVLKAVSELN
jgi:peroxiredoxin Q/BCP